MIMIVVKCLFFSLFDSPKIFEPGSINTRFSFILSILKGKTYSKTGSQLKDRDNGAIGPFSVYS